MTKRTGLKPAFGIACLIETRSHRVALACSVRPGWRPFHVRIILGDHIPFRSIELPGNPAHLLVVALSLREQRHLMRKITPLQPCETGGEISVPFAFKAVADVAGRPRSGIAARKGKQHAAFRIGSGNRFGRTGSQAQRAHAAQYESGAKFHPIGNIYLCWLVPVKLALDGMYLRKQANRQLAPVALMVLTLAACQAPAGDRQMPDRAAEKRGLALIEAYGCGACHEIPGVRWPRSRLGPSLAGFSDVGLIAGELPNSPAILAAFIRNAPAVKPGSTMPPIPLSQAEAEDIAAYLYGLSRD